MPAVGNDIVNLGDPDNCRKTKDRRFLNRVFTPYEQELIVRAAVPDMVLWSLWSAKEAAYKVVSKTSGKITSAPLRYEVRPTCDDPKSGESLHFGCVVTPVASVFFRLTTGYDFVHCLCTDCASSLDQVRSGIGRLDNQGSRKDNQANESCSVRQAAAEAIAAVLDIPAEEVEIRRQGNPNGGVNPPITYSAGKLLPIDLSLSHDFPWVAYAFIVRK